jgi:hypothetical protein
MTKILNTNPDKPESKLTAKTKKEDLIWNSGTHKNNKLPDFLSSRFYFFAMYCIFKTNTE